MRDATGMITGVVLRAGTSVRSPAAGACVTVTGGGIAARGVIARTSATGRYFVGGLAAGAYTVRWRDCARPAPAPAGGGNRPPALRVTVTAGQLTRLAAVTLPTAPRPGTLRSVVSPDLARMSGLTLPTRHSPRVTASATGSGWGGVSGRVTDRKGRPIHGICVTVSGKRGGAGTGTSATGRYRLPGFAPGTYTVEFAASCGGEPPVGNWAPQWYRGKNSRANANKITVRAGSYTRGINAVMRHGGQVTGLVTGRGGIRLSRVCVYVTSRNGQRVLGQATTVRGSYRVKALGAGRYRVYFDPACGRATPYVGQWWPGSFGLKRSRLVTVRLGAVTRHVNAALRIGGTITGTVRFASRRGRTLPGICVYGSGLGRVSAVQPLAATGKTGRYIIEGLPAGRYAMSFGPGCNNNGNYLYQNDPHPVQVQLATTVRVDAVLQPGAIITGRVTSAATGLPVSGICIGVGNIVSFGVTRLDGRYYINQVPPGRYSVVFSGGCGNNGSYAPQWFRGRKEPFHAGRVVLSAGKVTSGIDAAMRPGAGIAGTVTSSAGTPLRGICIGAFTPNEAGFLFGAFGDFYNGQTKRDGTYQIENQAPGQYQIVYFSCGSGPGWASRWYRSAPTLGRAGLLDVPAATTVTGVNATLRRGGAISGTVRAPSGQPYSFTCIIATNRASGATESTEADSIPSGLTVHYAISGLAPGRYAVEFYDCGGGGAATQWYSGKSSPTAANPVAVTVGHVTGRVDAVLARGRGSISGRVTSRATGRPVPVLCVEAFSGRSLQFGFGRTGPRGRYTLRPLATGRYRLIFGGCRRSPYASQMRRGTVLVRSPQAVRGVNFAVALAGTISGTVTGGVPTAAPRPGICVTAAPLSPSAQYGFTTTRLGGRYAIGGLAPGRYLLHFDPVGCYEGALPFAPQWYNGQPSRATATPVSVSSGAVTSGIDVTLQRDGAITGTVTTQATGTPLNGACVQATPLPVPRGASASPVYAVTSSGTYALTGLPPGRYLVEFSSGCGATGYRAQWWKDASTASSATAVTVKPRVATAGIDAAMRR